MYRCDSVRCSCSTEVLRVLQRSAKGREAAREGRGERESVVCCLGVCSFAAHLEARRDLVDGASPVAKSQFFLFVFFFYQGS